jgi:hypothetical protein
MKHNHFFSSLAMNTNEAAIAPDDATEPMPPPPPPSSVTALFYGAAAACFRVTLYRRHSQVLVRHRVLLQWTRVFARVSFRHTWVLHLHATAATTESPCKFEQSGSKDKSIVVSKKPIKYGV